MNPGKIIEFSLEMADHWHQLEENAMQAQIKVLRKLLRRALKTQFGTHYNFGKILKSNNLVSSFQEAIPFHDYEKIYHDWWHRTLEGQRNVTWRGKTEYFALSSGTSNATSKRIPISRMMFRMLRKSAFRLFTVLPSFHLPEDIYTKSWLAIGGTSRLDKIDGHFEGYLSGINARKRPFWAKAFYRPGDQIAQITDFDMRTDLIASQAADWDVGLIIGIPHWVQITLERILKEHHVDQIKDIWPNLRGFITGGVDYKPYEKTINKLVGRSLQYINTYLASEGMIALQDRPDSEDLRLVLDGGIFFEFIKTEDHNFDEDGNLVGNPMAYTIDQVEKDQEYAIVISTCSGAWRYLLGDTIFFIDPAQGKIRISGRTKYYINLCTEHLTGDNMTAAIGQAEEDLGIVITEFMIAPQRLGDYFVHHWYVGLEESADPTKIKQTLDEKLKKLNDDYRSERGTALSIELEVVPTNYFYEWQMEQSSAAGQSKIPRVIKGDVFASWIRFLQFRNPPENSKTNH